jgi:hypothetical protein
MLSGHKILLITGIIYAVFGLAIFGCAFWLLGIVNTDYELWTDLRQNFKPVNISADLIAFLFIYGAVYLTTGILGLLFRKKSGKASLLAIFGLFCLVSDIVFSVISGSFGVFTFILFILPISFIIGASLNMEKKAGQLTNT